MPPSRFALFTALDVLLRAAPCLGFRREAFAGGGAHTKKAVVGGLAGRLRSELTSAAKAGDVAKLKAVEDVVTQAQTGLERIEEWACEDVTSGLIGELALLEEALRTPEANYSALPDVTATLATVIMALDEKRCLKEAMNDRQVREMIDQLNSRGKSEIVNRADASEEERARINLAFSRLASWQEALVNLGSQMLDRSELYPRDVTSDFNCPEQCSSCSFGHGGFHGLFLAEEKDRFRCILDYDNRGNPPSKDNSKFHCGSMRRRAFVFWEFETWCTLPGWILDAYQNARISAMTTCGVHKFVATLRSNATMAEELLRTCMLVEQRMVVAAPDLVAYRDFMALEDDGVVPAHYQHAFGAYLALATAEGLVGLREASRVVPPAEDESWEELLQGGGYTLLPPSLVQSVPCNPPVNNWEVFLGAFAALMGFRTSSMLGALASIPLVLLSGFFFVLAGIVFLGEITYAAVSSQSAAGDGARRVAQLGIATAALIPRIFVDSFVSSSLYIYNLLAPGRRIAACPRGLLFLPGSSPVCLSDMEKLDAKRYDCPQAEGRVVVITCEPEFNGVATIRGEACPAR